MSDETLIAECKLCATYYKTFRKLRKHLKKRHADLEVLQCYFCDYITHDKIMFKQHKETSHADEKFVCENCDFKTRKWTRMERHFDKHKITKPITELPSSEDLSSPSRVKEAVHSTSRVKEVVHSTSTSRVKEAVQEIIHELFKEQNITEKLFNCDLCDKNFQSKVMLKEHVQVHFCDTVNESDHSTSRINEIVQGIDEKIKTQEMEDKRLVCEICKKHFQFKSELLEHSTVHTQDRPYKCTVCDYSCRLKSSLSLHMKIHSDERPFQCTYCEYKAKKKGHLTSHTKIHLKQREFACELCDHKLFTKQHLVIHMRAHTGEKPFKCHICETGFSQKHKMKSHLERVHFVPLRQEAL